MRRALAVAIALAAGGCLPAFAQDYYSTAAAARHGNGYTPSAIVAGWEGEASFAVIAITPDGTRVAGKEAATDWKATLTTGPRAAADLDDEEDDRYQDKLTTNPKLVAQAGPPVKRTETVFSSRTCPAVTARMAALKPLMTFDYDPPQLKGNQDGTKGDGREGFDLWVRVGNAELTKAAETKDSELGRWFEATTSALKACPAVR